MRRQVSSTVSSRGVPSASFRRYFISQMDWAIGAAKRVIWRILLWAGNYNSLKPATFPLPYLGYSGESHDQAPPHKTQRRIGQHRQPDQMAIVGPRQGARWPASPYHAHVAQARDRVA